MPLVGASMLQRRSGCCGNASDRVNAVLPSGLCPDWETWDPSQPVENAREAMQQADDWLGVPQVGHTCGETSPAARSGCQKVFAALPSCSDEVQLNISHSRHI